jgi:hypothetical protein
MHFQINIGLDPFFYDISISNGEAYLQTSTEPNKKDEQPSSLPTVVDSQPEISKQDDEAAAKAQLEQFNLGDLAAQNIASTLVKEKEVIVIEDDQPAVQDMDVLLKQYSDEIVKVLPDAVAQLQEAVREGLFEALVESITLAESLLDDDKRALFGPLEQHVRTAYGNENVVTIATAIKQQVLEKMESFAAAVNDAKSKPVDSLIESEKSEKVEVAVNTAENEPVESPIESEKSEKVEAAADEQLRNDEARKEELLKGLSALSPDDLGQLWLLLLLDEEGQAAELKALERPCPKQSMDVLQFINGMSVEKRQPFVEAFTAAAERR